MHWTDDWVGLPYEELGRGPAYDCLGLFLAVQRDRWGRELPDPQCTLEGGAQFLEPAKANWQRVDVPQEGDALVFRLWHAFHLGVAIDASRMLDTLTSAGMSRLTDFTAPRWGSRLEGIYRYDA